MSYPTWHTKSDNIQRTNDVIKTIAGMFKDSTVVTTIAPLNEPAGFYGNDVLSVVKQYWYDSYGNIRQVALSCRRCPAQPRIRFPYGSSKQSNTLVLLHDAFQTLDYWNGFQHAPDFQGVAMDTHYYQIFSDAVSISPSLVTSLLNQ